MRAWPLNVRVRAARDRRPCVGLPGAGLPGAGLPGAGLPVAERPGARAHRRHASRVRPRPAQRRCRGTGRCRGAADSSWAGQPGGQAAWGRRAAVPEEADRCAGRHCARRAPAAASAAADPSSGPPGSRRAPRSRRVRKTPPAVE
ncbi:MAG: hypothetical protein E6K48_02725 [Gammaproteobacteria bacterium]|nr:MAG: hypothetical protein E6K48_02725 [Gammaproteobacteria bacterium]